MSTIQRINGIVYFQVEKQMITKLKGKWITDTGEAFDRNKLHNIIHSKSNVKANERVHLRSIVNRHFEGNYKFN